MQITSTEEGKIAIILDASALSNSSCMLRMFRDTVIGYKETYLNNDTHFGTAFHAFRAKYRETGDDLRAMADAIKTWNEESVLVKDKKKYLTTGFLTHVCQSYVDKYQDDKFEKVKLPDGRFLIEPVTKFAFPFIITDTVEVLLAGTMDEIGKWRNGGYSIADAKTTSSWKYNDFLDKFWLSPQFLTYRFTLQEYAKLNPGSIWEEIEATNPSCFVDGVFYGSCSETGEQVATVKFARNREPYIQFKKADLEMYERLLRVKINQLLEAIAHWQKTKKLPDKEGIINGACNNVFGECKYAKVCKATDWEQRDALLGREFKIQKYNPLNFGGKIV